MVELESSSPEETERMAARLAEGLAVGDVVTVAGELGSGKTTFVRGAARRLGVVEPVTSPTYTVGNRYRGDVDVCHLDLYRFESVDEAEWGNLEDYFVDAVTFVEWPEAGRGYLPEARARIRLLHRGGEHRLIEVASSKKSLENRLSSTC